MAFIGIITNEKNILTMTKFLKNIFRKMQRMQMEEVQNEKLEW